MRKNLRFAWATGAREHDLAGRSSPYHNCNKVLEPLPRFTLALQLSRVVSFAFMASPNSIDALSDQQAIQALKLFYDLSTDRAWEGGMKPSPERIQSLAAGIQDEAPGEYAQFVDLLMDESPGGSKAHARASICRLLLAAFQESPELKSTVDDAVASASKLDMLIDPVTGTFIVVLALAVLPRIEKGPDGLKIIPAAGLESILKALPPVLSALPKEAWAVISAKLGG